MQIDKVLRTIYREEEKEISVKEADYNTDGKEQSQK